MKIKGINIFPKNIFAIQKIYDHDVCIENWKYNILINGIVEIKYGRDQESRDEDYERILEECVKRNWTTT